MLCRSLRTPAGLLRVGSFVVLANHADPNFMVCKVAACLRCSAAQVERYFLCVLEHTKTDAGVWVENGSTCIADPACIRSILPYRPHPLGVELVMPVRYR